MLTATVAYFYAAIWKVFTPPLTSTTITAEIADLTTFKDPIIGFVFMPDGSSSGGKIIIKYNDYTYTYDVNWLTGRLQYVKNTTK